MSAFIKPRTRAATRPARTFASLFSLAPALLLALVFCTSAATQARAQFRLPQQQQPTPSTPPLDADESDGEDDERAEKARPSAADAATLMRTARVVLVRSHTAFVSDKEVEDSLRKRKEFRAWGMTVTRSDADADLIIEIERKSFSRRFTFSVLDPRTLLVVTSGKTRSVLFGKKIPNKIAEKFVNRLKTVRPYPGD
ncbi:MAG TPA: hypothetical protein VFS10_11820 [Pyrinomonadaceae bacterium]|nr:hypothetical protein [Pyrinomonadaceae bacterium]